MKIHVKDEAIPNLKLDEIRSKMLKYPIEPFSVEETRTISEDGTQMHIILVAGRRVGVLDDEIIIVEQ